MKDRNIKKKMDIYQELAESNVSPELPKEIKDKGFFLIVRHDFDGYKKGERITEYDEIERIENKRLMNLVMKVNK